MTNETNPYAAMFSDRASAVAQRLRDLADRVERDAQSPVRHEESYAEMAATIQSDVLWGVANLRLDALTTHAARAQRWESDNRPAADAKVDATDDAR